MNPLLYKYKWHLATLACVMCTLLLFNHLNARGDDTITGTVEVGTVRYEVGVSGYVETANTASLTFPGNGRIETVVVDAGDEVEAGDLLASLDGRDTTARRTAAAAALEKASADRDRLLAGQTDTAAAITTTSVAAAETTVAETTITELKKVGTAKAALLSTGLTATATDGDETAVAPVISGSYTCETEGSYFLRTYRSSTQSGYSVEYSGLEKGVTSVSTTQSTPLGSCGLRVQFSPDMSYGDSKWEISIPNTASPRYAELLANYELAKSSAEKNIRAAQNELALAKAQADDDTAAPTTEELAAAQAVIKEAEATLASIDATLADNSIFAPFSGVVTNVDFSVGEVASLTTTITLIENTNHRLIARVPEIDIRKIYPGQTAEISFDANSEEMVTGTVDFVSPLATEIDGVAYYETFITMDDTPAWLRAGLNADIDIITAEEKNVPTLPLRFVTYDEKGAYVLTKATPSTPTYVTLGLQGSHGLVAVPSLTPGTVVISP